MKVLMIVPDPMVKGGIAAVVGGYRGSVLEQRNRVVYIESYRDGTRWQKLAKACRAYLDFLGAVRREKPDIVHIHSSFGPSFYRKMPFILWSRWKKIPVVNHIHGAEFEPFYEKASAQKRWLVRKVYLCCTKLIVLSGEWKEKFAGIVPEEKIEIVENYCRIPQQPREDAGRYRKVLFLGELGTRKGCYDIPVILEKAASVVPDVRLVMAGDGEMEQLREAFADRKLSERVTFPGWVRGEEKEKLLQENGIFLFPSYHEGMPMAVLEAMSYGMGIVTTQTGGIPKLIQDGENGFCKQAGDISSLSDALIRLLTDPAMARDMGCRARELAVQQYSLERHLQALQEVYEKVGRLV